MKQIVTAGLIFTAFITASVAAGLNTARIDELTGLKGKMNEKEGVYKVTFPRNDVKIVVDGWTMPPFMGLGTWAAFVPTKDGAMVMGDTVLFEDEVNAAMSAALDNGLNVKYVQALGGASAIDRVTSRVMKGTIDFGGKSL